MEKIVTLFQSLPLSAALRARISDPDQLRSHRFYLELPHGLAVLFPGVSDSQLNDLVVSSYLYFRTLLVLDDLLDGEKHAASESEVEIIFLYFSLYERAIRGLAALFPGSHCFWEQLEECKKEYALANQQEKRALGRGHTQTWTQQSYEQMAVGKSAVCGALVYALQGLGATGAAIDPILGSLRLFHLAVQYEDDVLDFSKDLAQGSYTYVYGKLREALAAEGMEATGLPVELLSQLLYTTGTATLLLARAAELYAQVQQEATRLGVSMLHEYASRHLSENEHQRQQIGQQIEAATKRAMVALQKEATS